MNGCSTVETIRKFSTSKNLKRKEDAPSANAVNALVQRFSDTGSLADLPRTGRPSTSKKKIDEIKVLVTKKGGKISTRRISLETKIPKSTVTKILKQNLSMHPYRVHRVHKLLQRDFETRKKFCQKMLQAIQMDANILSKFLMTDEAHFHLTGAVNTWNTRIWDTTNPHELTEMEVHSPKVTVWAGFNKRFMLEPFFFEDNNGASVTINSQRYCSMIEHHVIPKLKEKRAFSSTIFQQDGASPHTSHQTLSLLKKHFGSDRIVSSHCKFVWPSHSPDLNGCDFWLWGFLKARVYSTQPESLIQLKERIMTAYQGITNQMLEDVMDNFVKRLEMCVQKDGKHIEH